MNTIQGRQQAIILHEKDNVATAIRDLPQSTEIKFDQAGRSCILIERIPFGHKFSLAELHEGDKIYKYGVAIGRLVQSVKPGAHVHLHNLVSLQTSGEAE